MFKMGVTHWSVIGDVAAKPLHMTCDHEMGGANARKLMTATLP